MKIGRKIYYLESNGNVLVNTGEYEGDVRETTRDEDFTEWTAEECLQLARDFKSFKEQQLIKNKELQEYVATLTTVEDVQKTTWNTVIPSATTTA